MGNEAPDNVHGWALGGHGIRSGNPHFRSVRVVGGQSTGLFSVGLIAQKRKKKKKKRGITGQERQQRGSGTV